MGAEANLIGTIETTVKAFVNGREIGEIPISVPIHGWAPVSAETWERDGRRIAVQSDANKTVLVSLDLFRQVLVDLGFQKVEDRSILFPTTGGV